jgi:hypothetical protein
MLRVRYGFILLLTCLATVVVGAQEGPPLGRPPLVECVEGEAIPCVELITDDSQLVGTWRRYFEGGTTMGFTDYSGDGTFDIRFEADGESAIRGLVTFEDGLAMIAASPDGPAPDVCKAPGSYEVRMVQFGEEPVALTYRQVGEDNCPGRVGDLAEPWLYYTGGEIAELDEDMSSLAQPLVPCLTDEMDIDYVCDTVVGSPSEIVGIWKQYLGNPNLAAPMGMGYIHYKEDGTYVIADTPDNAQSVFENYPFGSISFDEGLATIVVDSQVGPGCETGDYYLRVIRLGDQPVALTYTVVADECTPRQADLGEALIWVSE